MKLIVTGATGFVGTEIIRLALSNPAITSIVALARNPVLPPENLGPRADISKLQSAILDNWIAPYPKSVNEQIEGADACIWSLAVTPTKSRDMDFAEVTKISSDYTLNGLASMATLAKESFRFVYVSGVMIERDQSKSLPFLADYRLMRGRVENAILDFAKQHEPNIQVTVTKPGAILAPGQEAMPAPTTGPFSAFAHTPSVTVAELAAAMIDQCLYGITKDPLWASDLVEIGQRALSTGVYPE